MNWLVAGAQQQSIGDGPVPGGVRPEWFPNWVGECAAVVAGGPSVTREHVGALKDRIHVVAINTSYELCPWADALYACDHNWWNLMAHKVSKKQAPEFKGLKVTQDKEACKSFPELKKLELRRLAKGNIDPICNELLMERYGEIGGGGNSGFQVVNWLVQVGISAIALIGFDFKDFDGKIHWHGRHPDSGPFVLPNPSASNFTKWTNTMTAAAPRLHAFGVDVVNCSERSALECFPKMSVEKALERWGL